MKLVVAGVVWAAVATPAQAFLQGPAAAASANYACSRRQDLIRPRVVSPPLSSLDSDDDLAAPNTMKVAEIKSELDMRGIPYADCFEKSELIRRLETARVEGRADPKIVDKFIKENLQTRFDDDLKARIQNMDVDALKAATAGDGTLPGGLTPEMMEKLTKNPDIMVMLQNPKMQEIMKAVMAGGPAAMASFANDKEAMELLTRLTSAMQI